MHPIVIATTRHQVQYRILIRIGSHQNRAFEGTGPAMLPCRSSLCSRNSCRHSRRSRRPLRAHRAGNTSWAAASVFVTVPPTIYNVAILRIEKIGDRSTFGADHPRTNRNRIMSKHDEAGGLGARFWSSVRFRPIYCGEYCLAGK